MLGLAVRDISKIIAWLCVRDDSLKAAQICFVTDPKIELDIELIKRMKRLFIGKFGHLFDTKEIVIELNGVIPCLS
jgi:hypothetical protein